MKHEAKLYRRTKTLFRSAYDCSETGPRMKKVPFDENHRQEGYTFLGLESSSYGDDYIEEFDGYDKHDRKIIHLRRNCELVS